MTMEKNTVYVNLRSKLLFCSTVSNTALNAVINIDAIKLLCIQIFMCACVFVYVCNCEYKRVWKIERYNATDTGSVDRRMDFKCFRTSGHAFSPFGFPPHRIHAIYESLYISFNVVLSSSLRFIFQYRKNKRENVSAREKHTHIQRS